MDHENLTTCHLCHFVFVSIFKIPYALNSYKFKVYVWLKKTKTCILSLFQWFSEVTV